MLADQVPEGGLVLVGDDQGGGAHAQGEELHAAGAELAEHGLVGDLLVHDQHLGVRSTLNLLRLEAFWTGTPLTGSEPAISPASNSAWPRNKELTTRVNAAGKHKGTGAA